jgi:hypothetical protein
MIDRSLFCCVALALFADASFAQVPVPPVSGDIAVSEVMFNPGPDACVTDANGEYFEITNISCNVLDLNGLFIQDTVTSDNTFFQILASVAVIPPVYPGQAVLFCRRGNVDSAINGGLTNVAYAYAQANNTPPADRSQVGNLQMNFGNSASGDGVRVTTGGPWVVPTVNPNGYVQGTEIELVTFISTTAPFTSAGSGQGGERMNLFAPMQASGSVNQNIAVSTVTTVMPCGTNTYVGTPGAANSTDTTGQWPRNTNYDSVNWPNIGTIVAVGPVSLNAGLARFKVTDSGNGLAFLPYSLGYSDDIAGEFPIDIVLPGNGGSIIIDLATSAYLSGYSFDATGADSPTVGLPNNPILIGLKFQLQWLAIGPNPLIVLSNGVRVTITP